MEGEQAQTETFPVEVEYVCSSGQRKHQVLREVAGPMPHETVEEMAARLLRNCELEGTLVSVVAPCRGEMLHIDRHSWTVPCGGLLKLDENPTKIMLTLVDQPMLQRMEWARQLSRIGFDTIRAQGP